MTKMLFIVDKLIDKRKPKNHMELEGWYFPLRYLKVSSKILSFMDLAGEFMKTVNTSWAGSKTVNHMDMATTKCHLARLDRD